MANVRCEFYYEADDFAARQARLLDAEMNIRDGNGSSKDFARYCRESGITKADALARGWFERRQGNGVRIGIYGSENLYDAFVNDKIGEVVAAKIAQAAPGNDALQRAGLREVMENGKSADYAVAVMQAAAVNAGQTSGEVQLDLFGADDSALNEARHMAEYATRKKRALQKLIRASQGAINDPKAFAKVTKTKVKDAEDAAGRLAKMAAEARRWENFAVHSELAAEARAWDGKAAVEVEVDSLPDAVSSPSYAMNISPETAETLDALGVMARGEDIVIHNAQYGDFSFEWGRPGREIDGKGGMGLEHIFYKRLQHGFSVDETACIAVMASMAAQDGVEIDPFRNVHRFDLNGVRAAVAFNAGDSRKVITGFVVTNEKNVKGAVDADAAKISRQFYASEALNRRQQMGAALKRAIAWYEDVVKNNPKDYDEVFADYAARLKQKQEAKVKGTYKAGDADVTYSMRLSASDVCRTRQEARAKVGRNGKPLRLENRFLSLDAVFSARSDGKFGHKDSLGRTLDALTQAGLPEEEAKTIHFTAYGNVVQLFAHGERMKFERAYKKKAERKGFLHVYSPFEIEGLSGDFEANIELEINQEKGRKPTAYLLNVSIQKRSQALVRGASPKGTLILDVPATRAIQSDFPEIVKQQAEPGYSMRWLGGEMVQDALIPERANAAITYLVDDMVRSVNKIGELGNILRLDAENDREQYINAVHDVTGKIQMLVMALPEKWRPSINRDLKYLRGYIELAMRGEVDLAAVDDEQAYRFAEKIITEHKNKEGARDWLKDLGQDKAHKQIEKILGRIRGRIEKWGKWQIQKQADNLFRMATPQVDLVTKRHKRGLMDAASTHRVMQVQAAWGMAESTWREAMRDMADSMADNEDAAAEAHFMQTFGSFERMNLAEATHALEELKKFVRDARTSWDAKLDAKRGEQTRKNQQIIDAVGKPTTAQIKENDKKERAWRKTVGIPADLQNMAQAYAHMQRVGLGMVGGDLQKRIIAASRSIQQARDERMMQMEENIKKLGWKSWQRFTNWMHGAGEIEGLHEVESPEWRERKVKLGNATRMRGLEGIALQQALAEADLDEEDWKQLQVLMESRDELLATYEEQAERPRNPHPCATIPLSFGAWWAMGSRVSRK